MLLFSMKKTHTYTYLQIDAHIQTTCMLYNWLPMPERTSVPRVCSTVLPPLQFCPLYSSAPSSEKQGRITVPRAWSTVLPHLQRSQTAALAPWGNVEDLVKTTTFIQTTGLTKTTLEYSRTVCNCNHSIHQANPKQIHPLTHSHRTRCLYNWPNRSGTLGVSCLMLSLRKSMMGWNPRACNASSKNCRCSCQLASQFMYALPERTQFEYALPDKTQFVYTLPDKIQLMSLCTPCLTEHSLCTLCLTKHS